MSLNNTSMYTSQDPNGSTITINSNHKTPTKVRIHNSGTVTVGINGAEISSEDTSNVGDYDIDKPYMSDNLSTNSAESGTSSVASGMNNYNQFQPTTNYTSNNNLNTNTLGTGLGNYPNSFSTSGLGLGISGIGNTGLGTTTNGISNTPNLASGLNGNYGLNASYNNNLSTYSSGLSNSSLNINNPLGIGLNNNGLHLNGDIGAGTRGIGSGLNMNTRPISGLNTSSLGLNTTGLNISVGGGLNTGLGNNGFGLNTSLNNSLGNGLGTGLGNSLGGGLGGLGGLGNTGLNSSLNTGLGGGIANTGIGLNNTGLGNGLSNGLGGLTGLNTGLGSGLNTTGLGTGLTGLNSSLGGGLGNNGIGLNTSLNNNYGNGLGTTGFGGGLNTSNYRSTTIPGLGGGNGIGLNSLNNSTIQPNSSTLGGLGLGNNNNNTFISSAIPNYSTGIVNNDNRASLAALRALQDKIQRLEKERDYYNNQCINLEDGLRKTKTKLELEAKDKEIQSIVAQNKTKGLEDTIKTVADLREKEVGKLQEEKHNITQQLTQEMIERQKIENEYKRAKEEAEQKEREAANLAEDLNKSVHYQQNLEEELEREKEEKRLLAEQKAKSAQVISELSGLNNEYNSIVKSPKKLRESINRIEKPSNRNKCPVCSNEIPNNNNSIYTQPNSNYTTSVTYKRGKKQKKNVHQQLVEANHNNPVPFIPMVGKNTFSVYGKVQNAIHPSEAYGKKSLVVKRRSKSSSKKRVAFQESSSLYPQQQQQSQNISNQNTNSFAVPDYSHNNIPVTPSLRKSFDNAQEREIAKNEALEDFDRIYSKHEQSLLHSPSKLDLQIKDIEIVKASLEDEYDRLQRDYKELLSQSYESSDPSIQRRIEIIKPQLEKKAHQIYLLERYKKLNIDSQLPRREQTMTDKQAESLRILRDFKSLGEDK